MNQILKYDVLLQWRQKFWMVYLFITIIYTILLLNIPEENRYFITCILIMFDTAILGITFVGAILLLEKQQNTLHSIFITPLSTNKYILSKTLSLALISFLTSAIIIILPNGFVNNLHFGLISSLLSSFIFTLIGIGFAAKTETLNQYIWSISIGTFWVIIPVIPFLINNELYFLNIFPVNAALDLLLSGENISSIYRYYIDIAILVAWCFAAFAFAKKRMNTLLIS